MLVTCLRECAASLRSGQPSGGRSPECAAAGRAGQRSAPGASSELSDGPGQAAGAGQAAIMQRLGIKAAAGSGIGSRS